MSRRIARLKFDASEAAVQTSAVTDRLYSVWSVTRRSGLMLERLLATHSEDDSDCHSERKHVPPTSAALSISPVATQEPDRSSDRDHTSRQVCWT